MKKKIISVLFVIIVMAAYIAAADNVYGFADAAGSRSESGNTEKSTSGSNAEAYKAFKDYMSTPTIEINSDTSISEDEKDQVKVSYMEIGKNNTPVLFVSFFGGWHLAGYVHLLQYVDGDVICFSSNDEFDRVYVDSGIVTGRYNQVGSLFLDFDRTYYGINDSGELECLALEMLIEDENGYKEQYDEDFTGSYYLDSPDGKIEISKDEFEDWRHEATINESLITEIEWISLSDFLEDNKNAKKVMQEKTELYGDDEDDLTQAKNPLKGYKVSYPGSKSENDIETAALVQHFIGMTDISPSDILMVNVDDFENTGEYGAFIFAGENEDAEYDEYQGEMWYTNGISCQRLEGMTEDFEWWERIDGTIKYDNRKYAFADCATYTSVTSIVWEVRDKKAVQCDLLQYGDVYQLDNGDVILFRTSYDHGFNYDDIFYTGRTEKPYYYYHDENSDCMTEYGGSFVGKGQIDKLVGTDLAEQIESNGFIITTAYYRGNGILNVNYIEKGEDGCICSNINYDCKNEVFVLGKDTYDSMPLEDSDFGGIYQSRIGNGSVTYPYVEKKTETIEIAAEKKMDFYDGNGIVQIVGHTKNNNDDIVAVVVDADTQWGSYERDSYACYEDGMTPLSWIKILLRHENMDDELGTYELKVTNGHVDYIINKY